MPAIPGSSHEAVDYSSSDGDSSNGSDPSSPTDAPPQNDLQLYEYQQFYQHLNMNPQEPQDDNVEDIPPPQVPEMATQSPQLSPSTSYPTLLPDVEYDGPQDAAVLSVIRAKNISYSVVMSTLADGYLEPPNIIVKVEPIHSEAQHDYILISDNYNRDQIEEYVNRLRNPRMTFHPYGSTMLNNFVLFEAIIETSPGLQCYPTDEDIIFRVSAIFVDVFQQPIAEDRFTIEPSNGIKYVKTHLNATEARTLREGYIEKYNYAMDQGIIQQSVTMRLRLRECHDPECAKCMTRDGINEEMETLGDMQPSSSHDPQSLYSLQSTYHPETVVDTDYNHGYRSHNIGYKALVLCNPHMRSGAEIEAEHVKHALEEAKFEVQAQYWMDSFSLRLSISNFLDRLSKENCSVAFVSIMAHGVGGSLKSVGGRDMPINNIMDMFSSRLPLGVSLVLLIQACQTSHTHSARISALYDQHMQLTRPNTVLLSATLTGGKAVRGAFSGAMADQIKAADGKRDIYQMFTKACKQMRKNYRNSEIQTPELRSTLTEPLVFQPATSDVKSAVEGPYQSVTSSRRNSTHAA